MLISHASPIDQRRAKSPHCSRERFTVFGRKELQFLQISKVGEQRLTLKHRSILRRRDDLPWIVPQDAADEHLLNSVMYRSRHTPDTEAARLSPRH